MAKVNFTWNKDGVFLRFKVSTLALFNWMQRMAWKAAHKAENFGKPKGE